MGVLHNSSPTNLINLPLSPTLTVHARLLCCLSDFPSFLSVWGVYSTFATVQFRAFSFSRTRLSSVLDARLSVKSQAGSATNRRGLRQLHLSITDLRTPTIRDSVK